MDKVKGALLICGTNGVGKSFLANAILAKIPGKRIHCKYRFGHNMFTYHQAALRGTVRASQDGLGINDRNWPSENIYGRVFRNDYTFAHEGRMFQKVFLKHAAIGVMCLIDPKKAQEQVQTHRSAGYHSPQFLTRPEEVALSYQDLWHGNDFSSNPGGSYVEDITFNGGLKSRPDWVKYEISKEGQQLDSFIEMLLDKVADFRRRQYQPALDFKTRNIGGHLGLAEFVIVGDQVNHPDYKKCWPFSAYSRSSLFITKVCHALKVDETKLMWSNACCEENHLEALLELKPSLKVIALGGRAEKEIQKIGASYRLVPHPAWGMRFSNLKQYCTEFSKAIV